MRIYSSRFLLIVATAVLVTGHPKPAGATTFNVTVGPGGQLIFMPSSVTIQAGDQVKWTWGSSGHSSTSGSPGMPNGIWDSGILNMGATFTHTFNSVGTFPFYCTPHGGCCGMVGTVIVVAPSPTPTATPGPSSTPTATPGPTATPTSGCYPNFTTAAGCDALNSLTIGVGNTGLGWRSLFLDTTGSFNTGVGVGALVLNTADSNTAVGAAALLLNTTGTQNTALGTDTLGFNDTGSNNTANGYFALMNNTTGGSNTATGWEALTANTTGTNNTAVGNQALQNNAGNSDNIAIGSMAGSGITSVDNNIVIGHHSGVHSVFGQISDRCTIDNIFGAPVSAATAAVVMVDSDGRLGTVSSDGSDSGGFSPMGNIRPQVIPDAAKQGMLNRTLESLQVTISQNQQQIVALTAQLKKQAAQIQKVNDRLEIRKPAAKVVVDKQAVP